MYGSLDDDYNFSCSFASGADTENEPNVDGLLNLASDVDAVIYPDSIRTPSYTNSETSSSVNTNADKKSIIEEDSEMATSAKDTTDSDSVDSSNDAIDYIASLKPPV
ncbi:hypothetical protein HPULCUR_004292 [Helicostylum pulchrum]|uniref:Uncharacterized protein n=1 Tax=Helicostylum pulchrum TaxID=562976 RepID=A0ABP9XVS5_9FUNG